MCYTYLTECKERVSCQLINVKQLGGLQYPTFDVVSVLQIANRTLENALTSLPLSQVISFALEMTATLIQCPHNSKVNHGIIKLYRCSHCTLSDYTLQR